MSDLFAILRFEDGKIGDGAGEGACFDVKDVPNNGEHFVSRLRCYLPLLEVWVRNVPSKRATGDGDTVKVYDIPITHILDHILKSPSAVGEMQANPGGAVVHQEKADSTGLGNEHVFAIATRPRGNARRNYMHGKLASSMPMFGSDGFIACSGRRVYVSDFVMCDLRPDQSAPADLAPCRIVRLYFDESAGGIVVIVRRFRDGNAVLKLQPSDDKFRHEGLVRVWEELGAQSEVCIHGVDRILGLCEVVDSADINQNKHKLPWEGGERPPGWSFFAEGFTRWTSNDFVRISDGGRRRPWRRAGGEDENYPNMRSEGVHHNEQNLPFANLPLCIYVDDFNVFGMSNPVRKPTATIENHFPSVSRAAKMHTQEGETAWCHKRYSQFVVRVMFISTNFALQRP